jgi:hypothetical protein
MYSKFLQRSLISVIGVVLSTIVIHTYALESREYTIDEFIPGTRCPKAQSDEYISICGTLRSHDTEETPMADLVPGTNKASGYPVPNVYTFLYECDPNEPTCKVGGKLVNPFSWSKTTANGQFFLQARKVGGAQVRYLVIACRTQDTETGAANFYIDSVHKFPSQHNIPNFIDYVSCQNDSSKQYSATQNMVDAGVADESEIAGPLVQMQFGPSNDVVLACDSSADNTGKLPATREINSKVAAAVEATFDLHVNGFDNRFTPSIYEGDDKTPGFWTGIVQGEEHVGGFWSQNCTDMLGKEDEAHCTNPGDTPDEYEKLLYTQGWGDDPSKPYVVQVFNNGIPPKPKLLAPREITARADYTAYTQDPFRVSQFILGSFGACLETNSQGKALGYRKYGEDKPREYYNCNSFRKCVSAFSNGQEDDYRNTLTVTGLGRLGAPKFAMYNMYTAYSTGAEEQTVCQQDDGTLVKFGEIQPWWDFSCKAGEDGCKYKLSSAYFDPYLLMVSVGKAPTTFNTNVFNVPDSSFQPKPGDTAKSSPFIIGQDGENATQAATRTTFPGVFTDVDGNKNNTMASSSAALADAVARSGANNFSDNPQADINFSEIYSVKFQEPSKDPKTRKLLLSGDFTMTNFGNEMVNYCQNNLQNGTTPQNVNSGNEKEIRIDNIVIMPLEDGTPMEGKDAHYCDTQRNPNSAVCNYNAPIPADDGAATGVSHVIFSSAALNRSEKIVELPSALGYLSKVKVRTMDAAMNTSMGTGDIIFDPISVFDILTAFVGAASMETPTIKTFYDDAISGVNGSPIGRDDFIVSYDKINTPYGTYEAVSEESFQRFFYFPQDSSKFETKYDNANPFPFPWTSSWGENYCYAWGNGIGTEKNYPPVENPGDKIEEKFGSIIPVAEYCGEGEGEADDRPLTFTKRYAVNVPPKKFINGKYDEAYPDESHFQISNTCRQVQCLTQGLGEKGTDCAVDYQRAWCAEQQLTTIKEAADLRCKYKQGPGDDPTENHSYCDNSYLKDGAISTAYCSYDEEIFMETMPPDMCSEPVLKPECCDESQRITVWYDFSCDGVSNPDKYYLCATKSGTASYEAKEVKKAVEDWIFCSVQVAGPFGAQGRHRQCDGRADFAATVEVVPQPTMEVTSQIDPLESTQIADNLMYRLLRLKFAPTDTVCFDKNDSSTCRQLDYRWRSGAINTVSASVIAKQYENEQGAEVTRDMAKIDSEGIGQSFSAKGMFATTKENWTMSTVLNEPAICSPDDALYGWNCEVKPVPNPEQIDLDGLDTSCKNFHPNDASCKALIFDNSGGTDLPNLSQTFINVMEAASSKFQVPPSLLLASLKLSGGFDEYRHYWTDEEIPELGITNEDILIHDPFNEYIGTAPWYTYLAKSYKNGKVYDCSNTDGGKQGPFKMWKLYYTREMDRKVLPLYGGFSDDTTAYQALEELSAGRGDVAREIRCNFLHSAYVAAAGIRNEATIWANEKAAASPPSCNTSDWSDWEITEKAVRYLQYPFVLDTDVARNQDLFEPFKSGGLAQQIMDACD